MVGARRLWASGWSFSSAIAGQDQSKLYVPVPEVEREAFVKPSDETEAQEASRSPRSRLLIEEPMSGSGTKDVGIEGRLNTRETAWLSFEFCILWVHLLVSEYLH